MGNPIIIGLAGWSGAGKTTLIAQLIPVLTVRGISVSTANTPIMISTSIRQAKTRTSIDARAAAARPATIIA